MAQEMLCITEQLDSMKHRGNNHIMKPEIITGLCNIFLPFMNERLGSVVAILDEIPS